jgi:2-methylcitrate dehydratase PrpD
MNRTDQTQAMAEFVAEFSDFPEETLERARRAVSDLIGVAIAGREHKIGLTILDYVQDQGAREVAGILGGGRTTPELAALANGTFSHALDFDDTNHPMYGHPSSHVVPAALAIGEEVEAPYGRLLEAFIVGFEVDAALGGAMNMAHYLTGFHATGTIGTVGAAAAAARMHGFDVETTVRALGIGASRAAGLRVNVGTMTKPLHAGCAAMGGVQAARLAARGWDAMPDTLESKLGFASAFMGRESGTDVDFTSSLGDDWSLLAPYGLAVKPFPTCGATHPAIHASLQVHGALPQSDIRRVRAEVSDLGRKILVYDRPETGDQARFSYQYAIACALARGAVTLSDFSDRAVADALVRSLVERVEIEVADRYVGEGEFPATISVETADGTVTERTVLLAKGKNSNPMSEDELFGKFAACLAAVGSADAEALWALTRHADPDLPVSRLVAATA